MVKLPFAFDIPYPSVVESFLLMIETVAPFRIPLGFELSILLETIIEESSSVPVTILLFFDWATKVSDASIEIKKIREETNFIYEINGVLQWTFHRKIFDTID